MALANFFDRAATAASQVLGDFDLNAFRQRLEANPVEVVFDTYVRTPEGTSCMDLLVRLLSRLYPVLGLSPVGGAGAADAEPYRALALSINPAIELAPSSPTPSVRLVIGMTAVEPNDGHVFYLGSDGWTARVSTDGPVGSGMTNVPFGAGAAASLGAANCFRAVFRDQLSHGDADENLTLSLVDYGHAHRDGPAVSDIDIGNSHLVGAGAIGNGFLWATARAVGLRGVLHVIDHETVDLGNMQRYVLTVQTDVDRLKTAIARDHLAGTSLTVVAHPLKWHGFLAEHEEWVFERVAVALDNAPDRLAVQAALPGWIVNAWTQELDLGISRHEFGRTACLACLYLPRGKVKDQDELIAEELGLPGMRMDVRRMLQTGEPVQEAFIALAATALGVETGPLMDFAGQPLIAFHQGAICGGVVMRLSNGAKPVRTVVPLAFQSALAGIMLAAELVKHSAGLVPCSAISARINLLRPLASYLADPKARDDSGRCICRDDDFLAAYARKYPS